MIGTLTLKHHNHVLNYPLIPPTEPKAELTVNFTLLGRTQCRYVYVAVYLAFLLHRRALMNPH